MVHIQVTWRHSAHLPPQSPHHRINPMQNSSADNLPSLSITSPTDDITSLSSIEPKPFNGYHDATKPFINPDSPLKAQRKATTNRTHDAEVKSVKREIQGKLKEDWEWPLPSTQPLSEILGTLEDIQEWRERDSDSSYSPPSPTQGANPYKFDTPDSLAQAISSKKRRRRETLKHEMSWNEGLRTFNERRDAWSGARTQPCTPPQEPVHSQPCHIPAASPTDISRLPTSSSPTGSSRPVVTLPQESLPMLLPIAPPILSPTNSIRAVISPAAYPSIYSKVIVQGLAPTIPINLKDVVNALVQGWKKDGEWPPKSEVEKPSVSGAGGDRVGVTGAHGGVDVGRKAVRRSVGRVKRVLGLGNGIDSPGRGEGRSEQ